jgi:hypothetical protein
MKFLLIITAFAVLTSAIVTNKIYLLGNQEDSIVEIQEQVISENETNFSEEEINESDEQVDDSKVVINSPTPTSNNIAVTTYAVSFLDDYIYPNSKVISSSSSNIKLESNDSDEIITGWYKGKIVNGDMNVRTSVKTKTNGKVLNKLVGADGEKEINIEISKEPDNPKVTIIVEIRL